MTHTNPDPLAALEAVLARQDEELERAYGAIRDLGDVQLSIPSEMLDEIDAATNPIPPPALIQHFIRA